MNLTKGKFQTQADSDFIAQQHKNSKLVPLKKRIQDAEKDKFWSDFQDGIQQKGTSRQTHKDMLQATGTSFRNPVSDDGQNYMNATGSMKHKSSKSKAFGDRNQTIAGPQIGIRDKLTLNGNKNPTTRGDTQNEMTPADPYSKNNQFLNHHEFDVSLTNQGQVINQSSMTNDFPPVSSALADHVAHAKMISDSPELDSQLNIQENTNNAVTQSPGNQTPSSKK